MKYIRLYQINVQYMYVDILGRDIFSFKFLYPERKTIELIYIKLKLLLNGFEHCTYFVPLNLVDLLYISLRTPSILVYRMDGPRI